MVWRKEKPFRAGAIISLVAAVAGILGTVSRAPIMGIGLMATAMGAIWSRWCLLLVCIVALAGGAWLVVDFEWAVTIIDSMGGEKKWGTDLTLDGEKVVLSSARHRIVLLQVFWPAMKEAGWLGYGSDAMRELPPKVPYLPSDEKTRERLKYVDNSYVFYVLRFGWLGAALFTLLPLVAIWSGIRLSWDRSIGVLAGGLAAMIISMMFSLATVWFAYDMGFAILWSYGVLAGLTSQRAE